MGRSFVRGILNSARGLSDKDNSPQAQAAPADPWLCRSRWYRVPGQDRCGQGRQRRRQERDPLRRHPESARTGRRYTSRRVWNRGPCATPPRRCTPAASSQSPSGRSRSRPCCFVLARKPSSSGRRRSANTATPGVRRPVRQDHQLPAWSAPGAGCQGRVLAHRDELTAQNVLKFAKVNPGHQHLDRRCPHQVLARADDLRHGADPGRVRQSRCHAGARSAGDR